jgi:hypothetical protein
MSQSLSVTRAGLPGPILKVVSEGPIILDGSLFVPKSIRHDDHANRSSVRFRTGALSYLVHYILSPLFH